MRTQRVGHLRHLQVDDRMAGVAVRVVLGDDGAGLVVTVFSNEPKMGQSVLRPYVVTNIERTTAATRDRT